MWKFVTRGIRETLERRGNCRTNVYSQTSSDNTNNGTPKEVRSRQICQSKFFTPIFASNTFRCCGSTKFNGTKDKQHDNNWKAKHTWGEAFRWSGVLALGWVICQSVCFRRRFFDTEQELQLRKKLCATNHSYLLAQLSNIHINRILPVTNCVSKNRERTSSQTDASPQTYGPITVEEALEEAGVEFARTHRIVMGEFELQFGLKALEEKRFKDALRHFSSGATMASPSSIFNLGVCYELGLGTRVDITKAAKYYGEAADKGHATAMYNLGVFHAQGRGGLPLDTEMARALFKRAADLGQSDARKALALETEAEETKETEFSDSFDNYSEPAMYDYDVASSSSTQLDCKSSKVDLNTYRQTKFHNRLDATQMFLDAIGLHEQQQPVQIAVGSYEGSSVPY